MSQFVIFVDEQPELHALSQLRAILGMGYGELKAMIDDKRPIYHREIFDNNFDTHAKSLRQILYVLEEFNVPARIYELPEDENLDYEFFSKCEMTKQVLRNLLDESDRELKRQLGE